MSDENSGNGKKRGLLFWIVLAAVGLFCVLPITLVVITGVGQGLGILPTTEPSATPIPSETLAPTETPVPSETPEPTATLSPRAQVRADIEAALGDVNRDDVNRIHEINLDNPRLVVDFAINDNLGAEMVKRGARIDVTDVLEIISQSGLEYDDVFVAGTFSMVDTLGNVSEDRVIRAVYTREILEQVNWENFLTDNIWEIAESATIHPEFR